jgi:hypothetical protein
MEEAATKWMSTMATKLKPRMVEKIKNHGNPLPGTPNVEVVL